MVSSVSRVAPDYAPDAELAAAVEQAKRVSESFEALGLGIDVDVYRDDCGVQWSVNFTSAQWGYVGEIVPEMALAAIKADLAAAERILKAERLSRAKGERSARASA